jgi:hypothetical protein
MQAFLVALAIVAFGLPAPVTLDGVAGARPGISAAALSALWQTTVRLGPNEGARGCRTATISTGAMRGYAIFERGRFGAVFFNRGAWTPSGIKIGSTLSALRRAYGNRLSREPGATQAAGYYFLTRRARPHWQIRFVVSAHRRVTEIGFGGRSVHYEEGCA